MVAPDLRSIYIAAIGCVQLCEWLYFTFGIDEIALVTRVHLTNTFDMLLWMIYYIS